MHKKAEIELVDVDIKTFSRLIPFDLPLGLHQDLYFMQRSEMFQVLKKEA